jgi:hypothetical protein
VDLAVSPFAISIQRYEAIDFCGYAGGSGTSILVRYPSPTISNWGMIKPFSYQVKKNPSNTFLFVHSFFS